MSETNKSNCSSQVWLTPTEAGRRIPGNPTGMTVRKWSRNGLLPGAIQLPSGRWKIPLSAIEAMMAASIPQREGDA